MLSTSQNQPVQGARIAKLRTLAHPVSGLLGALVVLILATALLYIPAFQIGDLGPVPDAVEYTVTAQRLARGESYTLPLPGRHDPPRYPFGFPALLAPAYWLPGATLQTGVYGVIAFAVAGVLIVYLLGWRLYDLPTGLLVAAVLLVLPQFIAWSHLIMSETVTMMLVALTALLFWWGCATTNARRRYALLAGAGVATGLAMLVRLSSVTMAVALVLAVLVGVGGTRGWVKSLSAVCSGPIVALVTLALYSWITFGDIMATGYSYWVPEWYTSGKTFSLVYAFQKPGISADPTIAQLSNLEYYIRSLTGFFPTLGHPFLTLGCCVLAVAGTLLLWRDRRRAARALAVYIMALSLLTFCLFAIYFVAEERFLAPIGPLAALAAAGTVRFGLRAAGEGQRMRWRGPALLRLAGGVVVIALLLQSIVTTAIPVAARCYLCRLTLRGEAKAQPAPELATIVAYDQSTPAGSLLVTDVVVLLFSATGVAGDHTILPLTTGEYWDKAPLLNGPPVINRQQIIDAALQAGTPVFVDSFSVDRLRAQGKGAFERFLALYHARVEVYYTSGTVTIYRLAVTP